MYHDFFLWKIWEEVRLPEGYFRLSFDAFVYAN